MISIIATGGKQYIVKSGEKFKFEKLFPTLFPNRTTGLNIVCAVKDKPLKTLVLK